jgi:acyl carrier protein
LVSTIPLQQIITDSLAQRLRQDGRSMPRIDPDADLIDLGVLDSQALLDVILDVEQRSDCLFDADGMDFERGVTLRRLAAAFTSSG